LVEAIIAPEVAAHETHRIHRRTDRAIVVREYTRLPPSCSPSHASLAAEVTKSLSIPTIGIGAGSEVDGQVLVLHDMLGINQDFSPRFIRRYANLHDEMIKAFEGYIDDVKSVSFPNSKEQY